MTQLEFESLPKEKQIAFIIEQCKDKEIIEAHPHYLWFPDYVICFTINKCEFLGIGSMSIKEVDRQVKVRKAQKLGLPETIDEFNNLDMVKKCMFLYPFIECDAPKGQKRISGTPGYINLGCYGCKYFLDDDGNLRT